MSWTIGCVPYVNAMPLVAWFELNPEAAPVRVRYDVPSRLPAMLDSGEADAILVSSVDALRVPGRRMAAGVCIGSHGPVKSVRLFSRVPPPYIRLLALDESSMTSNRLSQLVLHERFGIRPSTCYKSPDLAAMLRECDACVLIGDIGMTAASVGLHVLDLGDEWKRLTGKPFVWAAWIGNDRLSPELVFYLQLAASRYAVGKSLRDNSLGHRLFRALHLPRWKHMDHAEAGTGASMREQIVRWAAERSGWTPELVRDYFMNVMVYEMDEFVLSGLEEFRSKLLAYGMADCRHFPELVKAEWPEALGAAPDDASPFQGL